MLLRRSMTSFFTLILEEISAKVAVSRLAGFLRWLRRLPSNLLHVHPHAVKLSLASLETYHIRASLDGDLALCMSLLTEMRYLM
jgi:hypothetical protein